MNPPGYGGSTVEMNNLNMHIFKGVCLLISCVCHYCIKATMCALAVGV